MEEEDKLVGDQVSKQRICLDLYNHVSLGSEAWTWKDLEYLNLNNIRMEVLRGVWQLTPCSLAQFGYKQPRAGFLC